MFQCEKRPEDDKEKNNMPSIAFFSFMFSVSFTGFVYSDLIIIKYQNSETELCFGNYDSDITRGSITSTL